MNACIKHAMPIQPTQRGASNDGSALADAPQRPAALLALAAARPACCRRAGPHLAHQRGRVPGVYPLLLLSCLVGGGRVDAQLSEGVLDCLLV
jgi:hypothetical protein